MDSPLIKYWRKSLADGDIASPKTKGTNTHSISKKEFLSGQIDPEKALSLIEALKREMGDPKAEIISAPIAITPFLVSPKVDRRQQTKHDKADDVPRAAIWLAGHVSLNGKIKPSSLWLPWIERSCLEPLSYDSFSVGHVATVDRFLEEKRELNDPSWENALSYTTHLWKAVNETDLSEAEFPGYTRHEGTISLHKNQGGAIKHLIELYDTLKGEDLEKTALYPALMQEAKQITLIDTDKKNSEYQQDCAQKHSGHIGQHQLSKSQRHALSCVNTLQIGELLAVNGPPGTGKTTLVQSILSTQIVNAALKGEAPFVALATSSNNQAVTNLIDSLSEAAKPDADDILSHRWIPKAHSLGLYCIGQGKVGKIDGNRYLWAHKKFKTWQGFPEISETVDFVKQAENTVLANARLFFENNRLELSQISTELHNLLTTVHDLFIQFIGLPDKLFELKTKLDQSNFDTFDDWLTNKDNNVQTAKSHRDKTNSLFEEDERALKSERERIRQIKHSIDQVTSANDWWEYLLCFLPPVKKKQLLRGAFVLEENGFKTEADMLFDAGSDLDAVDRVKRALTAKAESLKSSEKLKTQLAQTQQNLEIAQAEHKNVHALTVKWKENTQSLSTLRAQFSELTKNQKQSNTADDDLIADPNRLYGLADIEMRRRMFFLALRYWESRWLSATKEEITKDENDRNRQSENAVRERYQRYAMLTPCFVSTCFIAPSFSKYFKSNNNKESKNKTSPAPMTGFFDMLIIDEAGQVAPEVGSPLLALAKKAVIVGDTKQIKPVVNLSAHVDGGNITETDLNEVLDAEGGYSYKATEGSLMDIAAQVSSFSEKGKIEKGMMLTEHRRCVDDIIQYCNQFYGGRLIPLRGNLNNALFPAMGYAHIRGQATKASGSWGNEQEANAIADWIARNKKAIIKQYPNEAFENCIAVVTPFRKQTQLVRTALKKHNIKEQITVGTVHALQGAERNIVLFSSVYSKQCEARGFFFDYDKSMLNVAVSRAKDSFLVFGDMEIFSPKGEKPSNTLAHMLFAKPENEILDIVSAQSYLPFHEDVERIDDLEKHRGILNYALEHSQSKILIVSPYLSMNALQADDVLQKLTTATKKNIEIKIVTCSDNIKTNPLAQEAFKNLQALKIEISAVERIHNKTLAVDDHLIVEGSFNWLSASRSQGNKEISLAYNGMKAASFIDAAWKEFSK